MEDLSHDVVAGLDWLRRNKPHIGWYNSLLTFDRHSVGFQIYSDSADILLCDTIFCASPNLRRERRIVTSIGTHVR